MANNINVADIMITMSVGGASTVAKDLDGTKKHLRDLGKTAEKSNNKISELWSSLKRIAMYRLLRTAIKSITQGFSEGIKNLYQWSKIGDGRFASAMDRMSTALLQMKNSLAVAIAPLIENVIVPLMEKLASIFIAASNQISMFCARLKGETKYLGVATTATKEYAQAQRSILGFDELNKLSGSSTDYSGMFAYYEMPDTSFGITIADFIVDFQGVDSESVKSKILTTLSGLTGEIIGFQVAGGKGAVIGTIAGVVLSLVLSSFNILNETNTTIDTIAECIADAVPGLLVGAAVTDLVSGAIGTAGGLAFGIAGGLLVALGLLGLDIDTNGKVSNTIISALIANKLAIAAGIFGWKVLGAEGAVLGASIGLALTLLIERISMSDGTRSSDLDFVSMVVGAFTGALIGALTFSVLGAAGSAVLGLTMAVSVTLLITEIKTKISDNSLLGKMLNDLDAMWGDSISLFTGEGGSVISGTKKNATGLAQRADGGFPSEGSVFIAGEAGPEFVGNVGGRTGVMNTDQMAESLAAANTDVVNAIYQIADTITNAINNQPVPSIRIGDREIYKASQRGARTLGGSLVQGV